MGSITIVNKTNSLINTSISAAVNYDWRNHVGPNEYVVLHGGEVWATLNARWDTDETSQYQHNIFEIGMFVAGTVVGIVGLVLAIPTGGASLSLEAGAALLIGGAGIAVGGLTFAGKDFYNMPAAVTGRYLPQNLRYRLDGQVKFTDLGHGNFKFEETEKLTLKGPLSDAEWAALTDGDGVVEARANPRESERIVGDYMSAMHDEILESPVRIYPSFAGVPDAWPAVWEVEGDGKNADDAAIRLSSRTDKAVEWQIKWAGTAKAYNPKTSDAAAKEYDATAYLIYNPALNLLACVAKDPADARLRTKRPSGLHNGAPEGDAYCKFFIVKSANCYAFVPISRQARTASAANLSAVTYDGGNIGNGTSVLVGDRNGPHPGWARWAVDTRALANRLLDKAGVDALTPEKLVGVSVRVYPAMLRRDKVEPGALPGCWQVEGDSTAEGALLQIDREDSRKGEWEIQFRQHGSAYGYSTGGLFALYNPALERYATVGKDGAVRATQQCMEHQSRGGYPTKLEDNPSLFFISWSMNSLVFLSASHGLDPLHVEALGNGCKLRVGPVDRPTLARWVAVPRTSKLAAYEKWNK